VQFIILRRNIVFLYLIHSFSLISGTTEPLFLNQEPIDICFGASDYHTKIEQLFSEPVLIDQITFGSDIGFPAHEFRYLTGLQKGQLVSIQAIKNAFFYLDLRQLFAKILLKFSCNERGACLHFELTGYERLGNVAISGLFFGKDQYLRLYQAQSSERFDLRQHKLGIQKILNLLKNEGYFNANIVDQIKFDQKTKLLNINLKINHGARFKISQVDVNLQSGSEKNDEPNQEQLNLKGRLDRLLNKKLVSKKYKTNLLIVTLTGLKKHLAQGGYPLAQIRFKIFKNQITSKIKINFKIILGPEQRYEFEGNRFFSNHDLFSYIMLAGSSILRLPISLIICDLIDFYHKNGFENVAITGERTTNCYKFLIHEGKRVSFKKSKKKASLACNIISPQVKIINESIPQLLGKTVLRGNAKMRFKPLFKFLSYQIGDVIDNQALETTLFRIKKLDSFDSIRIYPASVSDQDGRKPLILHLNVDHKLEFRTRLGFQKVSKNFAFQAGGTYKVGISVLYKNMTDCGDQLVFDADLTRFYRYIVAKYKRPIFLHVPLYFATNLYLNKYDQPIFIGSKNCLYHVYQQGALVDIGYQGPVWNVNLNLGLEGDMVSDISKEYARAIDFSDALLATKVPFLFIEPTVMIDRLDDKMNPIKGLFMLATAKGMVAMGSKQSYFLKILLEQSTFVPIFKTLVFAMRLSFGHIFTDQFNVIMPIERFYLGGAYSIRSYEPDFAPPLGVVSTPDCVDILVPQGGQTMMNACFELRVPIYQNFSGVLFQDLGALLKNGASLGQGELLSATGFGLRYKTPVGPVRFDIGWRPRQNHKSPNFAWFLTIGNAF
jgi:outer membrane protein assembly factor BamA